MHLTIYSEDLKCHFSFHITCSLPTQRSASGKHAMHRILTRQLILTSSLTKQQTPAEFKTHETVGVTLSSGSGSSLNSASTHSRYLVHGAGSDMAMKKQLVRIVNIMNRLNNVEEGLRKVHCDSH